MTFATLRHTFCMELRLRPQKVLKGKKLVDECFSFKDENKQRAFHFTNKDTFSSGVSHECGN